LNDILIAFVADLMFQTRIESLAERMGIRVKWLMNVNQVIAKNANGLNSLEPEEILVNHIKQIQPQLLIFDLGNEAIPWAEWIPVLKINSVTQQIPIICFGSHVDVGTLKLSRQVGADEVIARSRFVTGLPDLIQKYVIRRNVSC
jgi:DNA-binding NarL/FixJ family response regulator